MDSLAAGRVQSFVACLQVIHKEYQELIAENHELRTKIKEQKIHVVQLDGSKLRHVSSKSDRVEVLDVSSKLTMLALDTQLENHTCATKDVQSVRYHAFVEDHVLPHHNYIEERRPVSNGTRRRTAPRLEKTDSDNGQDCKLKLPDSPDQLVGSSQDAAVGCLREEDFSEKLACVCDRASLKTSSNEPLDELEHKRMEHRAVRNNLSRRTSVTSQAHPKVGRITRLAQRIVKQKWFDYLTVAVILANSVWIGIDADYNKADLAYQAPLPFLVINQLFTFYFFGECAIRFGAFHRKFDSRKDFWFMFDFLLMFLMVLENWILNLIFFLLTSSSGGSSISLLSNVSVLRVFRMLRLLRLLRMIRLLKTFPELFIILKAIATAARSVAVTLMILTAFLYVGGIGFSQVMQGTAAGDQYFPTVLRSMNTLVLRGALIDGISDFVADLTADKHYYVICLFYGFVVLANITLMNMLTGVLCTVISSVADAEQEALLEQSVKDVLVDALGSSYKNVDFEVEKEEFIAFIHDQDSMAALSQIGIEVSNLRNMVEVFFPDYTDEFGVSVHTVSITVAEIIHSLLQLRRQTSVSTKDLAELKKWFSARYDGPVTHSSAVGRVISTKKVRASVA